MKKKTKKNEAAFLDDFDELCRKYNIKQASVCGTNDETFFGTFFSDDRSSKVLDRADLLVGRSWEYNRELLAEKKLKDQEALLDSEETIAIKTHQDNH